MVPLKMVQAMEGLPECGGQVSVVLATQLKQRKRVSILPIVLLRAEIMSI